VPVLFGHSVTTCVYAWGLPVPPNSIGTFWSPMDVSNRQLSLYWEDPREHE
jgi:hypothetical protein